MGVCNTFLESLVKPETGSLPKYFTCNSCPTSRPKAEGCAIYIKKHNTVGLLKLKKFGELYKTSIYIYIFALQRHVWGLFDGSATVQKII